MMPKKEAHPYEVIFGIFVAVFVFYVLALVVLDYLFAIQLPFFFPLRYTRQSSQELKPIAFPPVPAKEKQELKPIAFPSLQTKETPLNPISFPPRP